MTAPMVVPVWSVVCAAWAILALLAVVWWLGRRCVETCPRCGHPFGEPVE